MTGLTPGACLRSLVPTGRELSPLETVFAIACSSAVERRSVMETRTYDNSKILAFSICVLTLRFFFSGCTDIK